MNIKRIKAKFYRSDSDKEPVRDWILDLSVEDKKAIGVDIKTVEFGWPIGMPTCRPLGKGLYEVRSNISSGRIARVLFCIKGEEMILLHSFIKKTQKTPEKDIDVARSRQRSLKNG